ncbi:hypothetical protein C8034_v000420 [Colletotrichum sidae]|uniref:Core Histone H2A/H2B/H3 domain-containing protein n=1 Tax=Colletotrichum sidae TaxID=1347389 RepID=A0A4R8TGQ9_9PEZI|nr:hypothetical protein C8034_v000420 [Colletotrichum sidae]
MASNSRSNSHTISFDYVSATLSKLRSHNSKDADVKISFEAFRFIQNATEDYLIKLMTMAQKLACHADMQMVRERDLRLAQELTQIWAGGVERFSYPQPNLGEEGIEGVAADDEDESSEMMTNYDERVDSGASDSEEDIWTAQDRARGVVDGLRKGRDDEDKSPKMTTSGDMSVHSETPGLGVGFIWDDLNGQWKEWAGGPYYKTDTDGVSLSGVSSDSRTMDVEENDRPEYGLLPPSDKDDEEFGPHNSKKRPFNFDDEDEDDDDDEDYEDVQGDESDEDDGDDEDDEDDWDDEDNDLLRPPKRLRLWEQEELDRRTFMNHHPLAPSAPKR